MAITVDLKALLKTKLDNAAKVVQLQTPKPSTPSTATKK